MSSVLAETFDPLFDERAALGVHAVTSSHEHIDIPVLVAGGQGRLRTGYYMDFHPRPFYKGGFKRPLGRAYNQLLVTAFKTLGLGGADYHKFGGRGFGPYDVEPNANAAHYSPSLTDADAPLPFLYKGWPASFTKPRDDRASDRLRSGFGRGGLRLRSASRWAIGGVLIPRSWGG